MIGGIRMLQRVTAHKKAPLAKPAGLLLITRATTAAT